MIIFLVSLAAGGKRLGSPTPFASANALGISLYCVPEDDSKKQRMEKQFSRCVRVLTATRLGPAWERGDVDRAISASSVFVSFWLSAYVERTL